MELRNTEKELLMALNRAIILSNPSIDKLLLNLLNYLRISLVISIILQTSKDEFVTKIDNSFLDNESEVKLEQLLVSSKEVFNL